ncbi:hypothetical protein [Bdellovibrio sp. NC01]|uniref:hypothetical protein n=1 Tax=Bdellovibrio sp. NC01 TaxID=2220073 RepID=UPI001156F8A6|nr:hypothetical protein [Bdellovibrio sp. NC01]QDK39411.1 hypothetical protein DOE51_18325 [Bdellovibrio sp. NC01]
MQRFAGVFGLFVVCFAVGYSYLRYTTDSFSINRDPAAIRTNFDFSNLTGDSLHEAVKQRLVAGFEMKRSADGMGLGLGHFVFRDDAGEKKLACQEFGKVTMTFEAEGVSVGGDKPTMEIEGRCEYSNDMTKINPLYLPVAKILNEKPGDGEFNFNEGHAVTVRFANLPEDWPRTWLLKSVKLNNEQKNKSVTVESDEVARYMGHPLVLTF